MSRRKIIWSYTENRYTLLAPFVSTTTPFEPYSLAAVSLGREAIVVLGRLACGILAPDLQAGRKIDDAHVDKDNEHGVYAWAPATPLVASTGDEKNGAPS